MCLPGGSALGGQLEVLVVRCFLPFLHSPVRQVACLCEEAMLPKLAATHTGMIVIPLHVWCLLSAAHYGHAGLNSSRCGGSSQASQRWISISAAELHSAV
jgi:hypothetical protein